MYSPAAPPPNHHQMTSENASPQAIQAVDSIAARLVLSTLASRCNRSRSNSSIDTITASSTPQCHSSTWMSTKFDVELSAASIKGEATEACSRWCPCSNPGPKRLSAAEQAAGDALAWTAAAARAEGGGDPAEQLVRVPRLRPNAPRAAE